MAGLKLAFQSHRSSARSRSSARPDAERRAAAASRQPSAVLDGGLYRYFLRLCSASTLIMAGGSGIRGSCTNLTRTAADSATLVAAYDLTKESRIIRGGRASSQC